MSINHNPVEWTGNIQVHHPVKQEADREQHWAKVADIMEAERERETREARWAAYYRDLLQHVFMKAISKEAA